MKKIRKTLTICLTASVLAVSSVVSTSAAAFKDVSGHWAETTINRWVGLGYINGYPDGTFRPKESITRTEFAVVANNAFNYQNVQAIYFPDVAATFWGYTEIQKAYAAGYMRGDANGTFRPKANVTRQEAAVMLANIKGLPVGGSAYFSDSSSISSWARGSVNAVVSAGYMSGYPDGSFRPKSQISRAEVVTMLNNALGTGGSTSKPNVPPTQPTTDTVQNMTLSNTTLRNTIVNGDLTIPSSMSSKSITLDNVTVRGKLNVEGGGTITAKDCVVNELVMDKSSAIFHGGNGTSVAKTTFRANGTLEGSRFEDVSVANSKVNTVTIDAEVENLTLDTDADVRLYGGAEVETFEITKNADDALIELSRGSRVRNMNVRDNVRIAGKGDIDNMAVYVSGVRSEIEPDSLSRKNGAGKPDFDWEYDGKRHESSGSSSSSSSGTDKTVSKNFDGDGAKFRNVRVTDRAKLEDMRITGDLTIEEEVENETVRLVDLEIDGDVYIYGGGENSVIFEDCEIDGNIISDKDSKASKSETVALEFDSKTKVRGEILIRNHTILKEGSGSPKLKDVVVEEKNVELDVNIDIETLELERYAEVAVSNGVTIDTLKINSKVSGKPVIDLGNTAVIKTLDARSDVKVTGNGTVNNVKESSGAKVELGDNIKNDPDDTKPSGSVTSVTLNKAKANVNAGKTTKLTATVATPDDKTDKTVTWSSSDEKIAKVSADGTVTGVAKGPATITATAKADTTKTAKCELTVYRADEQLPPDTEEPDEPVDPDAPVTQPTLRPNVVEMQKAGSQTLTLVLPEGYEDKTQIDFIEWKVETVKADTAETEVAVLSDRQTDTDRTRKLTGKNPGTAKVTVTIKDVAGKVAATVSCGVTVTQGSSQGDALTGVAIKYKDKITTGISLKKGTTDNQLEAVLEPDTAGFSIITWSSSDTSVVEPNKKNSDSIKRTYLNAKENGEAVITVTVKPVNAGEDDTGYTATCNVKVSDDGTKVEVTGVSLDKTTLSLDKDQTYTLKATVAPANATNKAVTWSSNKPNIATVDFNKGTVTAVAQGEATITATADNGKAASCKVTVNTPATETKSVRLNESALTLSVGGTETLTATTIPSGSAVEWESDAPTVATVANGRVEAKAPGTATITAALTADNTIKATCQVTVKPELTVTMPTDKATIKQGESQAYDYTVNPTDSELTFLFKKVGSAVAAGKELPTAVVENGKIKVSVSENVDVADYDFTVTATKSQQAKSTTHTITVAAKDAPSTGGGVQSVKITPEGNPDMLAGAQNPLQLTAEVTPADTGATVTWASSDTNVAEITSTGAVTAKNAGKAEITATAGNITSAPVTITVKPEVTITSIVPANAEVPVNEEITFTYEVKGFGDEWTKDEDIWVKAELENEAGDTEVIFDWKIQAPEAEWETSEDVKIVGALSDTPGPYVLRITVRKEIDGVTYDDSDEETFKVTGSAPASGSSDEPDEPDSTAPASQSTAVQPQPTPPRTFDFIPQREIQSRPTAPAVTVEPEKVQEPEKEPEKVQEPVKEPVKEPEKVQEPEKEPEKAEEPEQKPEQKQGIALTCADSFKAGETLTLSGTVNGVSSAMRKIEWSIRDAGATGAAIRDGVMSAEQAGTVTIAATVQNSTTTEYFTITVLPGEPKNDAPETQEPEQTPAEPQEPAADGQPDTPIEPNAPTEPNAPAEPAAPDGQTPVVTPPAVQVGTVTLPNGQVITNAKKYQRNVGTAVALSGLDALPANAAADSVAWKVESFGTTGAALQALDNTLVNVNAKGVILLSRTVRVTDANGNAAVSTTYYEITIV